MIYRDSDLPPDVDRSIVIACITGWVHGLDRETGDIRWARELDDRGTVHVAFRYGVLACSAEAAKISRLDYLSGEPLWLATTTGAGPATIVIEQDCIVCAKGGWVDCFDHDGRRIWARHINKGRGAGGVTLALPGNVAQAPDLHRHPTR
jgi:outer membrane protein assembly factor BamB